MNILLYPNEKLTQHCEEVSDLTDELILTSTKMIYSMYAAKGIGLAAPQVGILSRFIVMNCDKNNTDPVVMFNPKIVAASEELNTFNEGCLSFPKQFAKITRPKEVKVEWIDQRGNLQEQEFDGIWSTCVQHEIDHLDGKLFIDYLKPVKQNLIKERLAKEKKKIARNKVG